MAIWQMQNWVKYFGQTQALRGVSVWLASNKIYGLVGPNGSGKSTLVKALAGLVRLDRGKFYKNDIQVVLNSPLDAYKNNICAAHQELSLLPDLSVKDNFKIIANLKARIFNVNKNVILNNMFELLFKLRPNFPINKMIKNLRRADQQIIEIVKALGFQPELLLLDEPTSFLAEQDTERLFELLRGDRAGRTTLFVSHRLREIKELCDEVIVLRDGEVVTQLSAKEASVEEIVTAMTGKTVQKFERYAVQSCLTSSSGHFFRARVSTAKLKNVHIEVNQGEIVGLAGLVGHGQSEVLQAIYGLVPSLKTLELGGKRVIVKSPADAIRSGIVYISGTPTDVVFPERPVKENISIVLNGKKRFIAFMNVKEETELAQAMVNKLGIICRSINEPIRTLSGGNQQKVVLARALSVNPKVLLLDDPLKGIDTATKAAFYEWLAEVAKACAVIFFASDVEELLPIASRVLVMYEGRVIGEFFGEDLTKENILAAVLKGEEKDVRTA